MYYYYWNSSFIYSDNNFSHIVSIDLKDQAKNPNHYHPSSTPPHRYHATVLASVLNFNFNKENFNWYHSFYAYYDDFDANFSWVFSSHLVTANIILITTFITSLIMNDPSSTLIIAALLIMCFLLGARMKMT